jgi:hypothetical protein
MSQSEEITVGAEFSPPSLKRRHPTDWSEKNKKAKVFGERISRAPKQQNS